VRNARISVIIPVRDEERLLPGLLDRLRELCDWHEVIVADGGSRDRSRALAAAHPLAPRIIDGGPREERLNAALRAATGDIALILGADARPTRAAFALLARTRAVAGCLHLRHAQRRALFRWGDAFARLRARWTCGAYLDQAPFFARAAALACGGFRAVGSYDTADLGRRLRAQGSFALLPAPVLVSCRAWARGRRVASFLRYQRQRLRWLARLGEARVPATPPRARGL
jgi:glycosyltransferase involved in cell wall biosynthesis